MITRLIKFKNRVLYSCNIGITAQIPTACIFYHCALGVIIGNLARIGNNCQLRFNICIGAKGNLKDNKVPSIGNNALIVTSSILPGDIHIGDSSIIAASSVVLIDVPANGW